MPTSASRLSGLPVRDLPGGLKLIEARTLASRLRGVGGLDGLPTDQGLSIRAGSIHTFTVRFPLDLIWLAADGRVLRVDRAVPRWRIRICRGAQRVIEVSAGRADAYVAALTTRGPAAPE